MAGIGGRCPPDARLPDRSETEDLHVCAHEASHGVVARLLNLPVSGITVNADLERGDGGLLWCGDREAAFAQGDREIDICAELRKLCVLTAGEDRTDIAAGLTHAIFRCIELAAGEVGERLLLSDEALLISTHDKKQMNAYASIFCNSPEAVEAFAQLCATMARDFLAPHKAIIAALADVLKVERVIDGARVDAVIAESLAWQSLADERVRRAEWRRIEQNAAMFERIREQTDASP
jgi:hypothetical protein